jgi:RNA-directed DNA polymerase
MTRGAPVNSGAGSLMDVIRERVARTQAKYHRWAKTDRDARFGDLFNLVSGPDYLMVAWECQRPI